MTRRLLVEADGGSRGNPGPAGYGAVVRDADSGELLAEAAEFIGHATNNAAEYRGLIAGLRAAHALDPEASVEVRMDSKLVVEQMSGRWQIKHPGMRPLAAEARSVFPAGRVEYRWVPRERNKHADRLANEAMDAGEAGRRWTPAGAKPSGGTGRPGAPSAEAMDAGEAGRRSTPGEGKPSVGTGRPGAPSADAAPAPESPAGGAPSAGWSAGPSARVAPPAGEASLSPPSAGERAAARPSADETPGARPPAGEPSAGTPVAGESSAGTPAVGESSAGTPSAGESSVGGPSAGTPSVPAAISAGREPTAGPARRPDRGWGASPDLGAPTTLVLLRHGETPLTPQKRFSGSGGSDPALSERGRRQAERAAEAFAARGTIQAVVSSPLLRCRQTAEIVASRLGLDVRIDDGLRETDFGAWEGLTFGEARERDPEELDAWLASPNAAPPGGESFAATARRVAVSRDKLLARYAGRTVLVVTHVTPVKTLVRLALGAPPEALFRMELGAAAISAVQYWADGNASLRLFNDTSHLR